MIDSVKGAVQLSCVAGALAAGLAMPASAGTLTGDTVTVRNFALPSDPGTFDQSATGPVGPGIDLTLFGPFDYDFDGGPDGTGFSIDINIANASAPGVIELTDLDFSMNKVLVGFDIVENELGLTILSLTETGISFRQEVISPIFSPGTRLFSGTFVTRPAVIPLPATALMLLGAVGGLGALRLRKGRAAGAA